MSIHERLAHPDQGSLWARRLESDPSRSCMNRHYSMHKSDVSVKRSPRAVDAIEARRPNSGSDWIVRDHKSAQVGPSTLLSGV